MRLNKILLLAALTTTLKNMPLPLVLGAPAVVNGVAILVTGVVVADQVNKSLTNPSEGFSDNYAPPQLGGFDPVNVAQQRLPAPPENPVWDGRSTGTGLLENQLADSRRQSLRDSYMPLVGSPPLAPPQTTQAQGKSSSVPTPRSGEILRDKLSPQLGSAADLFQKNIATPFSNSIAAVANFNPNFQNFPFFGLPFFGNSEDQGDGVFSGFANGYSEDAGRIDSYPVPNPPPFKGGQSPAILYKVSYGYIRYDGAIITSESLNAYGAISYSNGIITYASVNGNTYTPNAGNFNIYSRNLKSGTQPWLISIVRLDGQPDTGGDPPALIPNQAPSAPPVYPPANEWLYGDVNVKVGGVSDSPNMANTPFSGLNSPVAAMPNPELPSVEPTPNPAIAKSANGFPSLENANLPSGVNTAKKAFADFPKVENNSFAVPSFQAKPFEAGKSAPSEQYDPIDVNTGLTRSQFEAKLQERVNENINKAAVFDAKENEKIFSQLSTKPLPELDGKSPQQVARERYLATIANDPIKNNAYQQVQSPAPANTTPNTKPVSNDTQTVLLGLAGLAATVTALKIGSDALVNASLSNTPKINQIAANTTPVAQQTNAKQGVCDAMQPQQCGYEGVKQATTEATNPIKSILENLANILAPFIAFSQTAFGKILSILNNTVIDRSLAVMNLATGIHNAAMLTRDIGETLGSVVDNIISLTPLRFTNSEGSQVQFTDFVGSNFRALLVSVLGVENYTSLVLNWQKANTIYHAGMGVLNTTQSMLDPISSAVEYGMENVSKIGNSLKEDGVVSENSYPAMDETIRARRVNRFQRLNDTLEGAENIASNLSSVTSSAVSIKEDYKQLREDAKDFKDKATAFNTADSEARAALKAELPTEITAINLTPAPEED